MLAHHLCLINDNYLKSLQVLKLSIANQEILTEYLPYPQGHLPKLTLKYILLTETLQCTSLNIRPLI